jgi:squalene cyclase
MHWLLPALIGGGVIAYAISKSSSSSSGNAATNASQTAQYNAAQAFDQQAQALGLTQAQAQQAWDIGLTPQEYVDSGMGTSGGSAASATGTAAAQQAVDDIMSSGPIGYYGSLPVYQHSSGAPVIIDDTGECWTFAEAA